MKAWWWWWSGSSVRTTHAPWSWFSPCNSCWLLSQTYLPCLSRWAPILSSLFWIGTSENSLVILTWYHLIYTLWVTLYWAYWIKDGYAFFVLVPLFTCLVRVLYCHSFLFKRKVFHNESSTITTLILYLDSQFHFAALFLRRHFSYRIEHTLQMFEDVERHDQIYFRWVPSSEQRKKTANNGEMVIV